MSAFAARYVTVPDPLGAFDRVTEAVGRLVAGTSDAQLGDPTPCTEWSVRDVLNHLVETLEIYGDLAAHGVMPQPGDRRSYDVPTAAFSVRAAAARAAFAAPDYLNAVASTPIGPQPGKVVVQHVINELTIHGWDLARGTGQDTDLVPGLFEAVLASYRAFFDEWDRAALSFNFFDAQPISDAASPADRLAAFMGRASQGPCSDRTDVL